MPFGPQQRFEFRPAFRLASSHPRVNFHFARLYPRPGHHVRILSSAQRRAYCSIFCPSPSRGNLNFFTYLHKSAARVADLCMFRQAKKRIPRHFCRVRRVRPPREGLMRGNPNKRDASQMDETSGLSRGRHPLQTSTAAEVPRCAYCSPINRIKGKAPSRRGSIK